MKSQMSLDDESRVSSVKTKVKRWLLRGVAVVLLLGIIGIALAEFKKGQVELDYPMDEYITWRGCDFLDLCDGKVRIKCTDGTRWMTEDPRGVSPECDGYGSE